MRLSEFVHTIGFNIDYEALEKLDGHMHIIKEQTQEVFGNLNKIAQGVQHVGRQMTLFVTTPLVALGFASVRASADVEQLKLAIKDVVPAGTDLKAVYTDLDKFSRKAGGMFDKHQVYEYANSLIQAGTPLKEITGLMQQFGDITAGDIGKGGKGVGGKFDMTQMVNSYTKMQTRGVVDMETLSGFGPSVMRALQKQLGMSGVMFQQFMGTHVVSASQVMKALADVAQKRLNAMAAQANTLNGLWLTSKNALGELLTRIGDFIVRNLKLKEALKFIINGIYKLIDGFRKLPGWIKSTIAVVAALITLVGPVLVFASGIGMLATSILSGAFALSILTPLLWGLVAPIISATTASWPLLLALAGIAIAIFLAYNEIDNWVKGNDSLIGRLIGPWEKFRDKLKIVFAAIKGILGLEDPKDPATEAKLNKRLGVTVREAKKTIDGKTAFSAIKQAFGVENYDADSQLKLQRRLGIKGGAGGGDTINHITITQQVPAGNTEFQNKAIADTTKALFDTHLNRVFSNTNKFFDMSDSAIASRDMSDSAIATRK